MDKKNIDNYCSNYFISSHGRNILKPFRLEANCRVIMVRDNEAVLTNTAIDSVFWFSVLSNMNYNFIATTEKLSIDLKQVLSSGNSYYTIYGAENLCPDLEFTVEKKQFRTGLFKSPAQFLKITYDEKNKKNIRSIDTYDVSDIRKSFHDVAKGTSDTYTLDGNIFAYPHKNSPNIINNINYKIVPDKRTYTKLYDNDRLSDIIAMLLQQNPNRFITIIVSACRVTSSNNIYDLIQDRQIPNVPLSIFNVRPLQIKAIMRNLNKNKDDILKKNISRLLDKLPNIKKNRRFVNLDHLDSVNEISHIQNINHNNSFSQEELQLYKKYISPLNDAFTNIITNKLINTSKIVKLVYNVFDNAIKEYMVNKNNSRKIPNYIHFLYKGGNVYRIIFSELNKIISNPYLIRENIFSENIFLRSDNDFGIYIDHTIVEKNNLDYTSIFNDIRFLSYSLLNMINDHITHNMTEYLKPFTETSMQNWIVQLENKREEILKNMMTVDDSNIKNYVIDVMSHSIVNIKINDMQFNPKNPIFDYTYKDNYIIDVTGKNVQMSKGNNPLVRNNRSRLFSGLVTYNNKLLEKYDDENKNPYISFSLTRTKINCVCLLDNNRSVLLSGELIDVSITNSSKTNKHIPKFRKYRYLPNYKLSNNKSSNNKSQNSYLFNSLNYDELVNDLLITLFSEEFPWEISSKYEKRLSRLFTLLIPILIKHYQIKAKKGNDEHLYNLITIDDGYYNKYIKIISKSFRDSILSNNYEKYMRIATENMNNSRFNRLPKEIKDLWEKIINTYNKFINMNDKINHIGDIVKFAKIIENSITTLYSFVSSNRNKIVDSILSERPLEFMQFGGGEYYKKYKKYKKLYLKHKNYLV